MKEMEIVDIGHFHYKYITMKKIIIELEHMHIHF